MHIPFYNWSLNVCDAKSSAVVGHPIVEKSFIIYNDDEK
jgi:hypothetical protein